MSGTQSVIDKQGEYRAVVQAALDEAHGQGAGAAEVGLGIEAGLSVTVRLGDIETLEYHHDKGLSVTVYFGQRKGSANTADFSEAAIRDTVEAACRIARYTSEDPCAGLADYERMAWDYPDLALFHPWNVSADQAVDIALACEQAARDHDPRIVNSEGASVSSHDGLHIYGNSHGFIGAYPSSRHSLSCSVIGREGESMQRDYWFDVARDASQLANPEEIGQRAAARTTSRLNSRRLSTRQAPVILAADIASGLFAHFTGAISGGSLYRKTTFLLDALHTQIFPSWMRIREVPHLRNALGSAPFDGEGVTTQARDLVHDGVLQGYILDSYSARKLGMATTGNAGGVHNLVVEPGRLDFPALLKKMDTGLLVTQLMGQGVNIVTGDYSRGAAGFWVENGEVQYPVEEITIAGNLGDMFTGIAAVATDVDLRRNIRTGSVLIENMTIAGE